MIKRKQLITLTAIILGTQATAFVYYLFTGKNEFLHFFIFGVLYFIILRVLKKEK